MNDTKPTAKAAKTVVSTWVAAVSMRWLDVVAGEIFVEPARVGVGQPRAVGRGDRAVVAVLGAPPGQDDGAGDERQQDEDDRDEVGGQAEAVVLGGGQDAVAVLRDQRVLDLALGLALRDEPADLAALGVGLRG